MHYHLLGKSGLRVSQVCLGAMGFGEEWGYGANREESRRIFDAFIDGGGNFVDTANIYTKGTSETFLGEFIQEKRQRLVLATKYTVTTQKDDANACGTHRKNMVQSLEQSLRRLKTDYVDLFYVHAWDFFTPVEEVMRGLDDLVRAGKILYAGISDTPAWIISQANTLAALRGWSPFVSLQIEYSLLERTAERDLLPMAKAFDVAVTAWAPLGGGVLTGKYGPDGKAKDSKRAPGEKRLSEKSLGIAAAVNEIAIKMGCPASQVALAWLMQQNQVVIPIVGVRTLAQMRENLGVLATHLNAEDVELLNEKSKIDLGFPHDFLAQDHIRKVIFGDMHPRIINHRS